MERKEVDLVYQELKKWFESYSIQVWLNEKENKFVVVGSKEKPDIIIYSPKINQYIAIEVKNGDCARDIYDAHKIIKYQQQYVDGVGYFINNKKIKIDSFAVATLQSMFGRLFLNEDNPKSIEDYKNDAWKYTNKKLGLEPLWEYPQSHQFTRDLWSIWRPYRKREYAPGIGVILSNTLNKDKLEYGIEQPILFDMQWEDWKKPQWGVRQKWL